MKRLLLIACMLIVAMTGSAFAGVVNDAKEKISAEKREKLVAKAKFLLEQKEKAISDIEGINTKLSVLEDGEDVEVYPVFSYIGSVTATGSSIQAVYRTY